MMQKVALSLSEQFLERTDSIYHTTNHLDSSDFSHSNIICCDWAWILVAKGYQLKARNLELEQMLTNISYQRLVPDTKLDG